MEKPAVSDPLAPLVLVVDDHADSREMYSMLLAMAGYRAAEAANGDEAIARALAVTPDCILMDLSLPGVNGWEATATLKADLRTKDIPVIAFSGHTRSAGVTPTDAPGFAAVVTKPCTPETVLAVINRVLGRA